MFADYVYEKASAEYVDKILLIDADNLLSMTNFCEIFPAHGFQIIRYVDDLDLRSKYDDAIYGSGKYVIVASANVYIPYDIRKIFRLTELSLNTLFPKLNASEIRAAEQIDYDLLYMAYKANFEDLSGAGKTERFISAVVYSRDNVKKYLQQKMSAINAAAETAKTFRDWINVSNIKSSIDLMATQYDIDFSTDHINSQFVSWVLTNFGKLSSIMDRTTPVLVSGAMEYMHDRSEKFAVVVMDGMSQFDWQILSSGFGSIRYEKSEVFAMIPTTTSISRQCLLSGKYPMQLQEPWKQSKEKTEFTECASNLGYTDVQIAYERGYDADFGAFIKCAAVIINEIDDTVHSQGQGRIGMFNDVSVMKKQGKLLALVKRLLAKGFDVYITADHGNTPCIGTGKLIGTGVETETKSRRMLVLRDFADKDKLISQYDMIEYPTYYLNKEFDYLICGVQRSFDARGDEVMSHGGISVDEVIVPFITIKAGENNG